MISSAAAAFVGLVFIWAGARKMFAPDPPKKVLKHLGLTWGGLVWVLALSEVALGGLLVVGVYPAGTRFLALAVLFALTLVLVVLRISNFTEGCSCLGSGGAFTGRPEVRNVILVLLITLSLGTLSESASPTLAWKPLTASLLLAIVVLAFSRPGKNATSTATPQFHGEDGWK